MGKKVSKKVVTEGSTNPCDRKPDKVGKVDQVTIHTYRDVPIGDAAKLIFCRRKDKGYWDDDIFPSSSADVCTVLIYYR